MGRLRGAPGPGRPGPGAGHGTGQPVPGGRPGRDRMRVRELSLRNYRVFEEVDLELPGDQVIGIFGPNGGGKSSLVESIAFACYGVDAARTKKNEIRTQGLLTDCEVRMVFEHGGQQYEVRRSIRGKGHTPEAELFVGGLVLAAGTTEVEAEMRRLLHMDLRVFRASVFAEQKQLDAFSDVTPGKRKEMALRLLGIRPVDDARTAARREARSTRQSAALLDAATERFAAAETEVAETTAQRDHHARMLEEAQDRLARASEADPSQPCPTCGRPLGDDFAGYVRHCREQVAEARKRLADAERLHRQAAAQRSKAEAVLLQARREAEDVQAAAARRDTLAQRVEELDAEPVRELEKLLAQLQAQRPHLDRETGDLERVESTLAQLGGRIQELLDEAEGLSFNQEAHARLRAECEDAEASVEAAREAERAAAHDLAGAEKRAGELSGRLEEARETERRAGDLRTEARYLERTGMLLDGFRDHLVTRVGPELSREAEALFRDLTNHEYDDLRIDDETLSIQIADGEAYHPIERFSGSETDLANLALRVAISTHLSRVSGADLGMLVLDEVLASLDVERKDLFVRAMGSLSSRFHQLFVITHAEQVKDQFPAAIEVRKVGRRRSQAALV